MMGIEKQPATTTNTLTTITISSFLAIIAVTISCSYNYSYIHHYCDEQYTEDAHFPYIAIAIYVNARGQQQARNLVGTPENLYRNLKILNLYTCKIFRL